MIQVAYDWALGAAQLVDRDLRLEDRSAGADHADAGATGDRNGAVSLYETGRGEVTDRAGRSWRHDVAARSSRHATHSRRPVHACVSSASPTRVACIVPVM